jgi:hypothetical protein
LRENIDYKIFHAKLDFANKNLTTQSYPEYERLIQKPLTHMAQHLATELRAEAPQYHFPQKGLGRIKRSSNKAAEYGSHYKNWISYTASRPRQSRFEHNPSIFFLINSEDAQDPVLLAGGLYMPSSRQTRALREALARDASAFEALFATKEFKRSFKGGFSDERISSRPTRGYDPEHPRMHWLRLQAFFVWRPYSKKEYTSPGFAQLVARDAKQILRMNRIIDDILAGGTPRAAAKVPRARQDAALLDRILNL